MLYLYEVCARPDAVSFRVTETTLDIFPLRHALCLQFPRLQGPAR